MKIAVVLVALFALSSCNTSIGLYRDSVQAFNWTKEKFQGSGGGSDGGYEDYGAPIY